MTGIDWLPRYHTRSTAHGRSRYLPGLLHSRVTGCSFTHYLPTYTCVHAPVTSYVLRFLVPATPHVTSTLYMHILSPISYYYLRLPATDRRRARLITTLRLRPFTFCLPTLRRYLRLPRLITRSYWTFAPHLHCTTCLASPLAAVRFTYAHAPHYGYRTSSRLDLYATSFALRYYLPHTYSHLPLYFI